MPYGMYYAIHQPIKCLVDSVTDNFVIRHVTIKLHVSPSKPPRETQGWHIGNV